MKTINFYLQGLGFKNLAELKISVFGFMGSKIVINFSAFVAFVQLLFGVDFWFLIAYAGLICLEWFTGVQASKKRKEKHESRKLGRMLLKILIYSVILIILNTFNMRTEFPVVFGFEVDPFHFLYWFSLIIIIWQLFVSLLENLDELKFNWAGVLLKVINKKFYENLGIEDESKSTK